MKISDTADLPMDIKFKKKNLSAYEYLCPDELTKQANNEINEEMNVEFWRATTKFKARRPEASSKQLLTKGLPEAIKNSNSTILKVREKHKPAKL